MLEIPLERLVLVLIPIAVVAWISWRWGGDAREVGVATLRMLAQLLLVGYVLLGLFRTDSVWLVAGVVVFMVAVSAWIAVRMMELRRQAWLDALWAIGVGGGLVLALMLWGVLDLEPWYDPRFVIPLAGMTFANAMTAVALSAERWQAEKASGKTWQQARSAAWNTALIPQINAFLAVGLVSLPGMMTGQILAGASPLDAVRYQVLVMALILGSTGLSVALFLRRTIRRGE